MEEVVEQSLSPEVAPLETNHEIVNESTPSESPVVQENQQGRNWKELNRVKKELERELRFQRELNERLLSQQQPVQQAQQEVDEFSGIAENDFIDKGKVEKLVEKRAKRIAQETVKNEVEKALQEREKFQFMDRLKRQYSDFDEVVNPETLSILEEQDPELAQAIAESQDPYKIGVQSYKYIKAMNLAAKTKEVRRGKEVDRKLEQNEKTVQSPMAYDKRPMAQAFRMSDTEKKKLAQEMYQYASMESSVPYLNG